MGKTRYHRLTMLTLALALLLAGCGPLAGAKTTQDERAQTEAPTPSTRRWEARPVLVTLHKGPASDAFYDDVWSTTLPELVIYANGLVITNHYSYTDERETFSMSAGYVSTKQLCSLLLEIERAGFFDFKPQDYQPPYNWNSRATLVKVEAWRTQSIDAYALEDAIAGELTGYLPAAPGLEPGDVPDALAETYQILSSYHPSDIKPYQPQKVAVLIRPVGNAGETPRWPLTPSIAELIASHPAIEHGIGRQEIIVEGGIATQIYGLFDGERTKTYAEGDEAYNLSIRPLLPLEIWQSTAIWREGPQFEDQPTPELECRAEGT